MPIKIIVADEHILIRKGLVSLLQNFKELSVVAEVSDIRQLNQQTLLLPCDVLLLDLNITNADGFELIKRLKRERPEIKSIVLSPEENDQVVTRAIEKGAAAFLSKTASPDEMFHAIKTAFETGYYFSDKINQVIINRIRNNDRRKRALRAQRVSFSDKEIRIIQLLSQELSNAEIGKEICLSHRTIETIRQQMIRKAGVRNAMGLVLYAAKNGMIEI